MSSTPPAALVFVVFLVFTAIAALGACATENVETRKACNHHCSVMYESCSERSLGGNTLNNCGYEDVRCNAMCPSK